MEFLPTVTTTSWAFLPLFICLVALGLMFITVIANAVFGFLRGKAITILLGSLLSIAILFVAGSIVLLIMSANVKDNLEHNLLQKYDIASVDYESPLARHLDPIKMHSQLIVLNLKDDEQVSFSLTQDQNNEPTLFELPNSGVSLEEITR